MRKTGFFTTVLSLAFTLLLVSNPAIALGDCDENETTPTGSADPNFSPGMRDFQWAQGGSPGDYTEIETGTAVELKVDNGKSPYTWTVEGTGFYWVDSYGNQVTTISTESTQVALHAGETGCGTVFVTVTDSSQPIETLTGTARSANGHWVTADPRPEPGSIPFLITIELQLVSGVAVA